MTYPLNIESIAQLAADACEMLPVGVDAGNAGTQLLRDPSGMVMADLLASNDDALTAFDAYLVAAVNEVPDLIAEIRRYRALLCEEHPDCRESAELGAACARDTKARNLAAKSRKRA